MKIDKLTDQQIEKIQEVKTFWIDYINSCKNSIDRDKAKLAIDWLYKLVGRENPIIIYLDSPMACQYGVHYLKEIVKAVPEFFTRDQVRDQVGAQVGAQVWDQVRDQVGAQVRAQVMAQVRAQVGAQVGDQVWTQVMAQVRAQKIEYTSFSSYGSIGDYGWVSFFDFFTQIGVINHSGFNEFKNVLTSGIYDMIQLNGFCVVSDMPAKLNRDERQRLHNANGPAIVFKDGYSQFYWHGVAVPADWILNPESISKETVIKEKNAEKRRCIMEILGESKYALLLDLETVETDYYNGQEVVLMKTIKPDDLAGEHVYFIKVICNSTLRNYYLCVPEEAFKMGAIGALAWTFGMPADAYKLLIET